MALSDIGSNTKKYTESQGYNWDESVSASNAAIRKKKKGEISFGDVARLWVTWPFEVPKYIAEQTISMINKEPTSSQRERGEAEQAEAKAQSELLAKQKESKQNPVEKEIDEMLKKRKRFPGRMQYVLNQTKPGASILQMPQTMPSLIEENSVL